MKRLIGFLLILFIVSCDQVKSQKEVRCYIDIDFLDSANLRKDESDKFKMIIDNNYESYSALNVFSYEYSKGSLTALNMELSGECVKHISFTKRLMKELRNTKFENMIIVKRVIEGVKKQSMTYNQ